MAVPTIDDVDEDGDLEIVVNLRESDDRAPLVLVYSVPGSAPSCMPWPTGRRDYERGASCPEARDSPGESAPPLTI